MRKDSTVKVFIQYKDFRLELNAEDTQADAGRVDRVLLEKLRHENSLTRRVVYANVREIVAQLSETEVRRLAGDHYYEFDDSDIDCS